MAIDQRGEGVLGRFPAAYRISLEELTIRQRRDDPLIEQGMDAAEDVTPSRHQHEPDLAVVSDLLGVMSRRASTNRFFPDFFPAAAGWSRESPPSSGIGELHGLYYSINDCNGPRSRGDRPGRASDAALRAGSSRKVQSCDDVRGHRSGVLPC